MHGAGRRIEADAVGDPAVAIGVVGEHDRDPARGRGRAGEPGPGSRQRSDEVDPVGHRLEAHEIGLGPLVEVFCGLEPDRAGKNPAVDLGQGDVHRQIARRQAALAGLPGRHAAAGEHELQDGAIRHIEGRAMPFHEARDRKARGVQHHVRRRLLDQLADQRPGLGIAQARCEDRHRVETARLQGLDQAVDHREITCLDQRPVEHHGRDGAARFPAGTDRGEVGSGETRPVEPGTQQRCRLAPGLVAAEQARGIRQKLLGIVQATVHAVLPQPMARLGRQRAPAGKLGIRTVVARQHR